MERLVKRFFGKKRGEHNMRSDRVGGAWWAVFSGLFLLAGCWMLANLLQQVLIPEWRANSQFRETRCRVVDTRLQTQVTDQGDTLYRPDVRVRYQVDNTTYDQWTYDAARMFSGDEQRHRALLAAFVVDQDYTCWYDPIDPQHVVLVRGYSWYAWLFLVLPAPFIALGGGGLVYAWLNWGKSVERRSMLAQRVARQPLDRESAAMLQQYPYVPSCVDLTNSTGTQLAYRLPSEPVGWTVLGLSLASIAWLGLSSLFLTTAFGSLNGGSGDWFLMLFAVVSTLGGIALVVATVRRFMVTTGIGPTVVEIARYPLYPGETVPIYLQQSGRLSLRCLRVLLVCEEEAHFLQGTNLRIEKLRVFEATLSEQGATEITPEHPWELRTQIEIPATAMHSFEGEHNKIDWRLVVEGDVVRWPDFRRSYTLIVYPLRQAEATP